VRKAVALLALVLSAVVPSAAAGAGPTPGVLQGSGGILDASGTFRFVTLAASGSTVVARVSVKSGTVLRSRAIPGNYGIPLVTFNGTAGGLSVDGQTLVLAPAGFAFRKVTNFAVFDTLSYRVARTVSLRGMFSFDALSPDSRTMYLVESLAENDPTYYRVRAFDLRANKLLPNAIVDRTEPDEQMRGLPSARLTGPGARWVYTLYGSGPQPFVHALDTVGRRAFCLDVKWTGSDEDLWKVKLALSRDGRELLLLLNGKRMVTLKAPA
jgi:hypothetical protein